jgi:hypothetical protein
MNFRHKDMALKYKVFKELLSFVGLGFKECVAKYFYHVDIELINEQVKLFYSAQDVV